MKNYFETRFKHSEIKEKIWKELAKYFQEKIPINEKDRVLDLGAGYCYFINNIKCKEKHALDISEFPLKNANREVKTHIGSCTNLSFCKSNYFDVIFCSNLLEHLKIEDIFVTLDEVYRILKNNGKFVILSPNYYYSYREYFDDFDHKTPLTHKNIQDILVSKKFKIEKLVSRFLPFSANETKIFNKYLFRLYLYSPVKPFSKQMLVIVKK